MKYFLSTLTFLSLVSNLALAQTQGNTLTRKELAQAVQAQTEIRASIKAIESHRGIECQKLDEKNLLLQGIEDMDDAADFEAKFFCNTPMNEETAEGGANFHTITVTGVIYGGNSPIVSFSSLRIVDFE